MVRITRKRLYVKAIQVVSCVPLVIAVWMAGKCVSLIVNMIDDGILNEQDNECGNCEEKD